MLNCQKKKGHFRQIYGAAVLKKSLKKEGKSYLARIVQHCNTLQYIAIHCRSTFSYRKEERGKFSSKCPTLHCKIVREQGNIFQRELKKKKKRKLNSLDFGL